MQGIGLQLVDDHGFVTEEWPLGDILADEDLVRELLDEEVLPAIARRAEIAQRGDR